MSIVAFLLNLPYTLVGLVVAVLSGPRKIQLRQNPIALIVTIKSLWWAIGYMRRARAATIGHVVFVGDSTESRDLEHELVHVSQNVRAPLIHPILYYIELFRKGYRNNKFEEEAYRLGGNRYVE